VAEFAPQIRQHVSRRERRTCHRCPQLGTGAAALQGRPNPFVGPTLSWFFNGTSSYHSGNVSLTKRSSRGLVFKTNYTFSKVLDLNSANLVAAATNEPATVANPYDLRSAKGVASFNLKHQFNANFLYPLPMGSGQRFGNGASGFADKLIGSWQWTGALIIQSGFHSLRKSAPTFRAAATV